MITEQIPFAIWRTGFFCGHTTPFNIMYKYFVDMC